MEQVKRVPHESVSYFFLKSKDVHVEEENAYITFFARLTREVSFEKDGETKTRIQTFWVDINELRIGQAPKKAKILPNCMYRYEISKEVFYSLYQLSKSSPEKVHYITPFHKQSTRKNFDD